MNKLVLTFVFIFLSQTTFADFEKGVALFNQGKLEESFNEFLSSAKQGDVRSMYGVGTAYFYGEGTKQDHKQAFKWIQKSANAGLGEARVFLGVMYDLGLGVKEDKQKAHDLWMDAAIECNAQAYTMLSFMYFTGSGVEKNPYYALAFAYEGHRLGSTEGRQAVEAISTALDEEGKQKAKVYANDMQQKFGCVTPRNLKNVPSAKP